jgi:hypothetical protein
VQLWVVLESQPFGEFLLAGGWTSFLALSDFDCSRVVYSIPVNLLAGSFFEIR